MEAKALELVPPRLRLAARALFPRAFSSVRFSVNEMVFMSFFSWERG